MGLRLDWTRIFKGDLPGYEFHGNQQLGTLYHFGRGVAQDCVTAAELHVLAAEAGDPVALGYLCSYMSYMEPLAVSRNPAASLSLATMYNKGLAVEIDQAKALAWVRRGRVCCTQEADDHVRVDLEKMESDYAATASVAMKMRAAELLAEINRSREAVHPS